MKRRLLPALSLIIVGLVGLAACSSRHAGITAAAGGEWASARRLLDPVVDVNSRDKSARRALANSYFALGEIAQAEKHFDRLAAAAGSDQLVHRSLALAREKLGWQVRALEAYGQTIKLFPDHQLTRVLKNHLARLATVRSQLEPEAVQNRVDSFRQLGLMDEESALRPLVILPFAGPSAHPELQSLAKCLSRLLAWELSALDLVWVIGPDEAQSFKNAGKTIPTGLIITGNLQKGFDHQIRADVLLAKPSPYQVLLDAQTVGSDKHLFVLESEVLSKLIGALGLLPNETERAHFGNFATQDPIAMSHYLQGLKLLINHRYQQALEQLEKSVGVDSVFPCPHRALSILYALQARQEKSQNADNLGRGRGNPRCVGDTQLLQFRLRADSQQEKIRQDQIRQGRGALFNGPGTLHRGL